MFSFIKTSLYEKFKDDEEVRELVVDALISMAYSEENIKYLQSNLENETIKFSPEQKYSILVRINTSKTIPVEEKD